MIGLADFYDTTNVIGVDRVGLQVLEDLFPGVRVVFDLKLLVGCLEVQDSGQVCALRVYTLWIDLWSVVGQPYPVVVPFTDTDFELLLFYLDL